MKIIYTLSIAIILSIIGGLVYLSFPSHRPTPVQQPISKHHKPHSSITTYYNCTPNQPTDVQTQTEIVSVAKAMQAEEKLAGGQVTAGWSVLNDKRTALIAQYDTCKLVKT